MELGDYDNILVLLNTFSAILFSSRSVGPNALDAASPATHPHGDP